MIYYIITTYLYTLYMDGSECRKHEIVLFGVGQLVDVEV